MHDVSIVKVTLLTILAGLFLKNFAMKELRGEIRDLHVAINRRFNKMDAELRYFHGATGEHKSGIDTIEGGG